MPSPFFARRIPHQGDLWSVALPIPRIMLRYGNIFFTVYVRRYNDSRIQR